jgi:hypothetical protein
MIDSTIQVADGSTFLQIYLNERFFMPTNAPFVESIKHDIFKVRTDFQLLKFTTFVEGEASVARYVEASGTVPLGFNQITKLKAFLKQTFTGGSPSYEYQIYVTQNEVFNYTDTTSSTFTYFNADANSNTVRFITKISFQLMNISYINNPI